VNKQQMDVLTRVIIWEETENFVHVLFQNMPGKMENRQETVIRCWHDSDLECSPNKRPATALSSINRLFNDAVYTEGVI
jgi:hypothetical protein